VSFHDQSIIFVALTITIHWIDRRPQGRIFPVVKDFENKRLSSTLRMEFFAKLTRVIAKSVGRLRPKRGPAPYRPEKHYMRGAGPKSKHVPPANGDRTPNAT
jgi:hypothetical protein